MKVAVTAQGAELNSPVDPRFGRAKNFVVVDTETGEHTTHDNQTNLNAVQGAGIQAARTVADLGVGAVLTGNVGPKAHAALAAAGIQVYVGLSGTVGEAVEEFKAGNMEPAERANVEGHWT